LFSRRWARGVVGGSPASHHQVLRVQANVNAVNHTFANFRMTSFVFFHFFFTIFHVAWLNLFRAFAPGSPS